MDTITCINPTYTAETANARRTEWLMKAKHPERVQFLHVIGKSDIPKIKDKLEGEVIITSGDGFVQSMNHAVLFAKGDRIVQVCDDEACPEGWDDIVEQKLPIDKPAVLRINDGMRHTDWNMTKAIFNKKFLETYDGKLYDPIFNACGGKYVDYDYTKRAEDMRCVIDAQDVLFKHEWIGFTDKAKTDTRWQNVNNIAAKREGAIHYADKWMRKTWGSVAIGCRIGSRPDPAFFLSWTNLITNGLRPGDVVLHPAIHLPMPNACNFLVERFLRTTCDSLFFLDDDMEFNYDLLEKLRARENVCDILSGLPCCSREPFNPVAINFDTRGAIIHPPALKGIVDVDSLGLACTLVHRRVIRKMMTELDPLSVFTWHNRKGEDGMLCERAKALGFKVQVDADVLVGHRVEFTVWWDEEKKNARLQYNRFGV